MSTLLVVVLVLLALLVLIVIAMAMSTAALPAIVQSEVERDSENY